MPTKKKSQTKFPKDKKGYVTVRVAVAVDEHGKTGIYVLDDSDTLERALDIAFGETSGDAADLYLMERTFKAPAVPKIKRVKPKTKKAGSGKNDDGGKTKSWSKKAGVAKKGAPAEDES